MYASIRTVMEIPEDGKKCEPKVTYTLIEPKKEVYFQTEDQDEFIKTYHKIVGDEAGEEEQHCGECCNDCEGECACEKEGKEEEKSLDDLLLDMDDEDEDEEDDTTEDDDGIDGWIIREFVPKEDSVVSVRVTPFDVFLGCGVFLGAYKALRFLIKKLR